MFDQDELDRFIAADPDTFPPEFYSQGAAMVEPWRLSEIARRIVIIGSGLMGVTTAYYLCRRGHQV